MYLYALIPLGAVDAQVAKLLARTFSPPLYTYESTLSRGTARRDSSETEPTGKIVMRRASPFLLDLRRCHAIRVMRRANVGRRLSVAGPSATAEATERLLFRRINARHRAKRCDRNGTNGQDRHATSFPLPPGPHEMPLGPQGCLASFFSDSRSLFLARLLADVHMFCPDGLELSFCVIISTHSELSTFVP